MKKLLSLVAMTLVSLAMLAGENDLLWDYTEGYPSNNPDPEKNHPSVKLYYGAKVTDGPGTGNGLYGIKMNGSGYAYFTKPAVEGKLKLGFGPRNSSNAESLVIMTWEGDAASSTVPSGLVAIDTTGAQAEYGYQIVPLTAEQNNIYIKRLGTTESVLQYLEFKEYVPRDFTNFKIDFRSDPYAVQLPADGVLPAGIEVTGSYHDPQHGYENARLVVPVDGPVRFTIGTCQYGSQATITNRANSWTTTIDLQTECDSQTSTEKNVTYTHTGEKDTLVISLGKYCPYIYAEATDITPCEIIFKDQTGKELGRVATFEGATLDTIPYSEADLPTFPDSYAFRGWFYTNGKKAKINDPINGNTTISAKVTPIEYVTVGSVQTYDFANQTFYPEDHETVEVANGSYYNNHGWYFAANGSIRVKVAGNAVVTVTLCQYSETGDVIIKAGDTELGRTTVTKNSTPDASEFSAQYVGDAGWLTINWTNKQYIHKVMVYNVQDFPVKDDVTGYYIVPSGDAGAFLLTLVEANKTGNTKIFLPNGIYDLGETVLTTVSGNNISIIGESTEGVIIRNAPDAKTESIDKTATLKINKNVQGTYLQDLTIQNNLDYYKNNNGRAVALWDQGTKTICKNVRLLSYQDTYYSNLVGAVKYMEDCEIHGTVDFICGDGSVFFQNNLLVCEQRSTSGGGSDALTASNASASDKGYVFNRARVRYAEGITGTLPVVSFGRSWNNAPKCVFLNTILDDRNGKLNMQKDASAQKDKINRWTLGAMNALPDFMGEYRSVDTLGNVVSPASNECTFVLGSNEKTFETILTDEQAANYTIDKILGSWAAEAQEVAKQAVVLPIDPEGIYLVEHETSCEIITGAQVLENNIDVSLLRRANARGGFGLHDGDPLAVKDVEQEPSFRPEKKIQNGQLIISYGDKNYNALGAELK